MTPVDTESVKELCSNARAELLVDERTKRLTTAQVSKLADLAMCAVLKLELFVKEES